MQRWANTLASKVQRILSLNVKPPSRGCRLLGSDRNGCTPNHAKTRRLAPKRVDQTIFADQLRTCFRDLIFQPSFVRSRLSSYQRPLTEVASLPSGVLPVMGTMAADRAVALFPARSILTVETVCCVDARLPRIGAKNACSSAGGAFGATKSGEVQNRIRKKYRLKRVPILFI